MSATGNSVAFQVTIAASATPQQLPANILVNGGTFAAKTGNSTSIAMSPDPLVTSSTGFLLDAGLQIPFAGNNTNQLWIAGTMGDVLSFLGN